MLGPAIRSERTRPPQLPVLLPAGQPPAAKLQGDAVIGRIEAGNAGGAGGNVDFRAGPAGMVNQRQAQRGRGFAPASSRKPAARCSSAAHRTRPASTRIATRLPVSWRYLRRYRLRRQGGARELCMALSPRFCLARGRSRWSTAELNLTEDFAELARHLALILEHERHRLSKLRGTDSEGRARLRPLRCAHFVAAQDRGDRRCVGRSVPCGGRDRGGDARRDGLQTRVEQRFRSARKAISAGWKRR